MNPATRRDGCWLAGTPRAILQSLRTEAERPAAGTLMVVILLVSDKWRPLRHAAEQQQHDTSLALSLTAPFPSKTAPPLQPPVTNIAKHIHLDRPCARTPPYYLAYAPYRRRQRPSSSPPTGRHNSLHAQARLLHMCSLIAVFLPELPSACEWSWSWRWR